MFENCFKCSLTFYTKGPLVCPECIKELQIATNSVSLDAWGEWIAALKTLNIYKEVLG